jgi:hypothetical protein
MDAYLVVVRRIPANVKQHEAIRCVKIDTLRTSTR